MGGKFIRNFFLNYRNWKVRILGYTSIGYLIETFNQFKGWVIYSSFLLDILGLLHLLGALVGLLVVLSLLACLAWLICWVYVTCCASLLAYLFYLTCLLDLASLSGVQKKKYILAGGISFENELQSYKLLQATNSVLNNFKITSYKLLVRKLQSYMFINETYIFLILEFHLWLININIEF